MAVDTLGTRLKAERERRGLPLEQVAASTKIPSTLLEALERGDLSRWPKGLYRRAFFRSYVAALGLPQERLVAEFTRVFPDDTAGDARFDEHPSLVAHAMAGDSTSARPDGARSTVRPVWRSVAIALVEVAVIVAIGAAVAWFARLQWLEAVGAIALVYLPAWRVVADRRTRANSPLRPAAPANGHAVSTDEQPAHAPAVSRIRLALTNVRAQVGERCKPAGVTVVAMTRKYVVPGVRHTGHVASGGARTIGRMSRRIITQTCVALMRGSRATGRASAHAASQAFRASAVAFHWASLAFWKGVRSLAERAELIASRRLNRTRT